MTSAVSGIFRSDGLNARCGLRARLPSSRRPTLTATLDRVRQSLVKAASRLTGIALEPADEGLHLPNCFRGKSCLFRLPSALEVAMPL